MTFASRGSIWAIIGATHASQGTRQRRNSGLRRLAISLSLGGSLLWGGVAAAESPAPAHLPSVNAIVPNFYYKDLKSARHWYVDQLGLKPTYDDGWVVILEFSKGMQLALVDEAKGLMRAVDNKGTMLSIETDELEEWYRRVSQMGDVHWYEPEQGVRGQINDHKDMREFRVLDPGGYLIEFYQWKPEYRPKRAAN